MSDTPFRGFVLTKGFWRFYPLLHFEFSPFALFPSPVPRSLLVSSFSFRFHIALSLLFSLIIRRCIVILLFLLIFRNWEGLPLFFPWPRKNAEIRKELTFSEKASACKDFRLLWYQRSEYSPSGDVFPQKALQLSDIHATLGLQFMLQALGSFSSYKYAVTLAYYYLFHV